SFPIHSMPVASRGFVETITLIGPPTIDPGIEDAAVRGPIAANQEIFCGSIRAEPNGGSNQAAAFRFDDDMQDDSEMLVVKFMDRLLWIRKICRVPGEFGVASVPA